MASSISDVTARPRLVSAAVSLYVAIAVVNALVGCWILSYVPAVVAGSVRAGKPLPAAAVAFAVGSVSIATLLFSGALIFFAMRLRAGSTWARPALLTISLLSLAALFIDGVPGVAVIVLCIAAAIVVTRAPVSAWLRRVRGLAPA